jgi:RNA polymerase sigma-70 factor (ECF subfamily)
MGVDLQACVDGDKQAWDDFVDRCSGVIVAAVRRVVGKGAGSQGAQAIEDPVQEVFLRLIKHDYRLLRSFDPDRASLSTWLTLVARSVAVDQLRRRRLPSVPLTEQELPTRSPIGLREPPVPVQLLTGRQRLVLDMLFGRQMSVAQVAAALAVDPQTVRSTKHKALIRLREQLEDRAGPETSAGMNAPVDP